MEDLPILYINHIDNVNNTISIPAYYYSWRITNKDGTITQINGENFFHPLDKINSLPRIQIPYNNNFILLTFSSEPAFYTVQYWIDSPGYYNDNYKIQDNYIPVSGNHLLYFPNSLNHCVIQVNADWPQGNISYDFYVSHSI